MATKFYNEQARFFNKIVNGANFEDALNEEIERIKNLDQFYKPEAVENIKNSEKNRLLEVKSFFEKIKFFEKREIYAVNAWGYGQTNYENLIVLGKVGATVVCVIEGDNSHVFTISTKKYNNKDSYTYLDNSGVRSTSWRAPYSDEKINENFYQNALCGH